MSKSLTANTGSDLDNAVGLTSSVTVIKSGPKGKDIVTKNEKNLLHSNALTVDDGERTLFDSLGRGKCIQPTYDPILLSYLMQQNNTLLQCAVAMEVNIDGTGYEIERLDGKAEEGEDDEKIKQIKQFFDEVYPGESFVTQRRALRRDLESTGCGYIEVLRNQGGEIVFLRRLDAKLMRLVLLDEPVQVTKTVMRMGKETKVEMLVRERRFCQQVGSKLRFFREFEASRDVDMLSGEWLNQDGTAVQGSAVLDAGYNTGPAPSQQKKPATTATQSAPDPTSAVPEATKIVPRPKGTEVIYLTVLPDVGTGYGVPRWINQIPSVLGSRKAEEFNLEFFNAGGLPPAIVLVQNGQLSPESKKDLTNYLSGKAKFKQRGVIAEIYSATGTVDSTGSVRVTVERFGDERQKDSMFQNYDKACADHVRMAFRLPPLFLGQSQDQNFATAVTSYRVAEAQVFRPEREEFDEIVNVKIMRAIAPEYLFRSLPMQINDVENQLKAMELAKEFADPEEYLKTINELASVTLTAREGLDEEDALGVVNQLLGRDTLGNKLDRKDGIDPKTGKPFPPGKDEKPTVVEADKKGKIKKLDDDVLRDLADDWSAHVSGRREFEPASVAVMHRLIKSLAPGVKKLFNSYVGLMLTDARNDVDGVSELIARAGDCLAQSEAA